MTHPIIGLMGKKRHGKDSVASVLVYRYGFKRFAFADALKEAALALDPIIYVSAHAGSVRLSEIVKRDGWEEAKENFEVRRTLQRLGVAIREIDAGFWVNAALNQAARHLSEGPVVVTDVRFPNEYEAIRDMGGTLVRVYRPGMPDDDMHPSETALDNYTPDWAIINDGTLDDLAEEVVVLAAHLRNAF